LAFDQAIRIAYLFPARYAEVATIPLDRIFRLNHGTQYTFGSP
jgi:hypothetical protein